jgi:hypothetical protein
MCFSDAIWAIQYIWNGVNSYQVTLDEDIIHYLYKKNTIDKKEYMLLQEEWADATWTGLIK